MILKFQETVRRKMFDFRENRGIRGPWKRFQMLRFDWKFRRASRRQMAPARSPETLSGPRCFCSPLSNFRLPSRKFASASSEGILLFTEENHSARSSVSRNILADVSIYRLIKAALKNLDFLKNYDIIYVYCIKYFTAIKPEKARYNNVSRVYIKLG